MAIAHLFRSERCLTCLTTNFDNAIEQACNASGVGFETFSVAGKYPEALPAKHEKPLIIKLHGDASEKTCVAESTEILEAESQQTHGRLRELLNGRKVLVVGYSGYGDVDISKHLKESKANLFWANHEGDMPLWANHLVNSSITPDGKTQDLLAELAGYHRLDSTHYGNHASTTRIIESWLDRSSFDSKRFIDSIFEWRKANALLHLYLSETSSEGETARILKEVDAYIQRRCYRTALKHLSRLNLNCNVTSHYANAQLLRAFAFWRVGRLEKARQTLASLLYELERNGVLTNPMSTELKKNVVDASRVYLEICRDLLQFVSRNRRKEKAKKWRLKEVSDIVEQLSPNGALDSILYRVVTQHIDWLLQKNITVADVEHSFNLSLDSTYLNAAWAAVGLWMQISFLSGWAAYKKLNDRLKKVGRIHYIRKNLESVLTALARRPFVLLGPAGYLLARSMIFCAYNLRTMYDEHLHRKEASNWVKWHDLWEKTGKINTEL